VTLFSDSQNFLTSTIANTKNVQFVVRASSFNLLNGALAGIQIFNAKLTASEASALYSMELK